MEAGELWAGDSQVLFCFEILDGVVAAGHGRQRTYPKKRRGEETQKRFHCEYSENKN